MIRGLTFILCAFHFPLFGQSILQNEIIVDGVTVNTMAEAESLIVDNSIVYLGAGNYSKGIHIKHNNVILSGSEGTHFVNAVTEGKGAIITSGNNITVENIECSKARSSAGNGACIRHQGKNLTVSGVYFHDSEQGILEAGNDGKLVIKFSRFERVGKNGRAHGVYSNGAQLVIDHCSFTSMVSQAHSVKSRSRKTIIKNTLFSTKKGNDSRIIDIPNGGELVIHNSILHQNNNTKNRQVIGYGLEKQSQNRVHKITIAENLVIMEREKGNEFLALPKWGKDSSLIVKDVHGNVLIGKHIDHKQWVSNNTFYKNRNDATLLNDKLPTISALPQSIIYLTRKK